MAGEQAPRRTAEPNALARIMGRITAAERRLGKLERGGGPAAASRWGSILDVPASFPPSSHDHAAAEVVFPSGPAGEPVTDPETGETTVPAGAAGLTLAEWALQLESTVGQQRADIEALRAAVVAMGGTI